MTDTFTPITPPVAGSSYIQTEAKVDRAEFGDGYSQRSPEGLNSIRRAATLHWDGIPESEAMGYDAFFAAKLGAESFFWTRFGASSPELFTCASWKGTPQGAVWSFDATFVPEFDL